MKLRLLLLMVLVLAFTTTAYADTGQDLVVVLLIDQSGSMLETDPDDFRFVSAGMMVNILGHQDQLGLLTFSSEVNRLHELSPLGDDRTSYQTALASTGAPQGNTDYLLALQEARTMLREAGATRSAIVFLTDGEPYPNELASDDEYLANYLVELNQFVEQLALENTAIYTVGFGDSPEEILEPMSTTTHGLSFINSQPNDLAGNFFSIVSSLKGREVLVEETLTGQASSYRFDLDANTTQLNGLVLGEFTNQFPTIVAPGGNRIPGEVGEGYVSFVLSEQELSRAGTWTLEVPQGTTQVKVARDTRIRMEILSPSLQSEFSEEAVIDLALRVHGSEEDLVLEARPLLNGEPQSDWKLLTKQDGLYTGQLSELTSSGQVAVEVRARSDDTILTRQEVPLRIKRIPELHVKLVTGGQALVSESEVAINAWLTRNQQTLQTNRVAIEEFRWVGPAGEGTVIPLRDDGLEGDLIEGDGVYTLRLTLNQSGKLAGEIQAVGTFGEERFQLTRILEDFVVAEAGTVEVTLNNGQAEVEGIFQPTVQLPLLLVNQATYPETITITTKQPGITIKNPTIRLQPGQRVETQLQFDVDDQNSPNMTLDFLYTASNSGTNLTQQTSQITLLRQSTSQATKETLSTLLRKYGVFFLGAIVLLAGGILATSLVKKQKTRSLQTLSGYLHYRPSGGDWQSISLQGTEQRIAFGTVKTESDYVLPGRKLGFVLTVRRLPGALARNDLTFQLHCGLPGVITTRGLDTSTTEVRFADQFYCGGYECMILDKPIN